MGENSFSATPGERSGQVRFVRGLVVAKPDLGWKAMSTGSFGIFRVRSHRGKFGGSRPWAASAESAGRPLRSGP